MTIEDQKKEVVGLAVKIVEKLKKKPTIEMFYDFLGCLKATDRSEKMLRLDLTVEELIKKSMKGCKEEEIESYYDLYTHTLKYAAYDLF